MQRRKSQGAEPVTSVGLSPLYRRRAALRARSSAASRTHGLRVRSLSSSFAARGDSSITSLPLHGTRSLEPAFALRFNFKHENVDGPIADRP